MDFMYGKFHFDCFKASILSLKNLGGGGGGGGGAFNPPLRCLRVKPGLHERKLLSLKAEVQHSSRLLCPASLI